MHIHIYVQALAEVVAAARGVVRPIKTRWEREQ